MSLIRIRSMGRLAMMLISVLSLSLAGCGGGGGGDGVSTQVVSGVAAAGAPLSGTVSLKDASATAQEKTANIAGDGTYAIDVTGMLAPFIIKATGSAGGTNYTLCSFSTGQGRANVNPLSNLAVADAAGVNDPATVYLNPNLTMLQQIGNNLDASVSRLQSRLQALLDIYNAASIDPITGQYVANGTGMDALFDDVRITMAGGNVTMMNMATNGIILNAPMSAMNSWSMATGHLPSMHVAPAAPIGVTSTGGAGQVTVSWPVVPRASSYNLYWSTTPGVTTATGAKITAASSPHIHSGLANSTSYYYIVTAVNSAGESAASSQASATTTAAPPIPTVPAAPSGVSATGGTRQVTVAWPAVAGATSYNIYWATTSGVTKTNGTRITGATSPAVHSSLTDGTTYYYIVTAVNSIGESAPSAQFSAATLSATPTVPATPTGVGATGGTRQVTVTWPAVSSATSYNLYWSTTSGVTTVTGTKIAGATSPYIHSGLADSTAYYYVLTAVNSAGESASSAQVTATTTAPALTCGTCHAIPPALGQHSFHDFTSCATCHGTGYSSTTVNAATHMNGVKNVGGSSGWNAATRSCSNSCHGTRGW
jgi:fibronectin type 3 domain-containing protein